MERGLLGERILVGESEEGKSSQIVDSTSRSLLFWITKVP